MLGVVPAAGAGSRIQPLAFSKELLPVGSRIEGGLERPRAVSEYLIDRMILAGVSRLCFVISPGKSDILGYYGGAVHGVPICYVVQAQPLGLCDAIFRACPVAAVDEPVLVGLPDTVWFPADGYRRLPDDELSLLLFQVDRPEFFDAVVVDASGRVLEVQVKSRDARSRWIWGAIKVPGRCLVQLRELWERRDRRDVYLGTLVNAYLSEGGRAVGVRAGESYVDVGTLNGYREALQLLSASPGGGSERR
jgi:glucose-1-phosphate thymidylyltransferase